MSERRSFYRKVGYLVAIAVLWIPISLLSQPASVDADGNRSPGGKLARERDENHLSQATLGKIDPASETMKLATLGMRGVAVQLLWNSLHHYQMVEDWSSVSAVVNQIIRLQPNFFSVWDFEAHNQSYNISVEFDDYRDRFYWVMKGIEFLKDGYQYNATDPRFLARIGWFYGNKIGKADEHVQYRRLFAKQQQEKGERLTDNWLVAHDWYKQAQALVDSGRRLRVYVRGESLDRREKNKPGQRAPSPLLFHSEAAMALINYADTIEEEGALQENEDQAKGAWENAAREWQLYSDRELPTPYGYTVRLNQLEEYQAKIKDSEAQLEKLLPGERDGIRQSKIAKLTTDERHALEKKRSERTADEYNVASLAEVKTNVSWEEVALNAPPDKRPEARRLADEIAEYAQKAGTIDTYRGIVNYNYWLARCLSEPTDDCLEARKLLYLASKSYDTGELFEARKAYEQSFAKWRIVLDKFPVLRDNNIMADELVDEIDKYKKAIGKIPGEKFPDKFILQDMIDLNEGKRTAVDSEVAPPPEKAPEKKPAEKPAESPAKAA